MNKKIMGVVIIIIATSVIIGGMLYNHYWLHDYKFEESGTTIGMSNDMELVLDQVNMSTRMTGWKNNDICIIRFYTKDSLAYGLFNLVLKTNQQEIVEKVTGSGFNDGISSIKSNNETGEIIIIISLSGDKNTAKSIEQSLKWGNINAFQDYNNNDVTNIGNTNQSSIGV